jgi:cytochrome P450
VPFGAGPRQCIGNHFAMMELQLILATLIQRVTLTLPANQPTAPDPQMTLRPPARLRMIVEHRAR